MAKPATLDRTRSYGESRGLGGEGGVRFTQDYKNFDHAGKEIMPSDAAPEGDYDDWDWKALVAELKKRAGKGPKGMKRSEVIDALRELDAAVKRKETVL